jgi:RNA polymerase sigma factor (sigma-70 family)
MDMDVRAWGSQGRTPAVASPTPAAGSGRPLTREQVAAILGQRQRRELRIARGFLECRDLSRTQLEDLFQETVLALLHRPYQDEKHLCDALRKGVKQRALNLYRDERRRTMILAEGAPAMHALAMARGAEAGPEQLALARQDRLVITEFLAELSALERRVFWLASEGMKYHRIATTLGIPVNQARNALASCERKRERFQTLHDSGRLCGYRSTTIKALLEGQATSAQLAQLALAHVQACAHCRAEHHTNAQQLRRAFQDQAAALLPPILLDRLGRAGRMWWLGRTSMHARMFCARLQPGWVSLGQGGVRERAVALVAGTGASAKLAAGVVAVAVIAGGTITATHALHEHDPRRPTLRASPHAGTSAQMAEPVAFTQPAPAPPISTVQHNASRPKPAPAGHLATITHPASRSVSVRREPGGFAYLGVPTNKPAAPTPAATTSAAASVPQPATTATHTGGPFSP